MKKKKFFAFDESLKTMWEDIDGIIYSIGATGRIREGKKEDVLEKFLKGFYRDTIKLLKE